MYPEPTKDAQLVMDPTGVRAAGIRCLACAKAGSPAEFSIPLHERQSPRVPEIDGLNLETRKSGGPFHQCTRHKPPVVLIRWQILRSRPPPVRGSP
jgi:hypothetical protein